MERRLQEVFEEDGGLCSNDKRGPFDTGAVVQEGGLGAVSGSGECESDGEDLHEELDLSTFSPRLRARFEKQTEEDVRLTCEQKESLNQLFPDGRVLFDRGMSQEFAIGIGGKAEAFLVVNDMLELKKIMEWCQEMSVDHHFVGSGSKSIVRDGGIRGILVRLSDSFDAMNVISQGEGEAFVEIGSSVSVRKFVGWCVENGFTGLENFLKAQGTVAGCVMTAIKPHDGELPDMIDEITILNKEMKELTLKGKSLRFEATGLKIPRTAAITRIVFKMKKDEVGKIAKIIDEIEKKNSEISSGGAKYISKVFHDQERLTASEMVDDANMKGIRIGKARVSTVDGNIIVNEGDASPKDLMVLIGLIKDRVRQETGIVLEPAIYVMGDRE